MESRRRGRSATVPKNSYSALHDQSHRATRGSGEGAGIAGTLSKGEMDKMIGYVEALVPRSLAPQSRPISVPLDYPYSPTRMPPFLYTSQPMVEFPAADYISTLGVYDDEGGIYAKFRIEKHSQRLARLAAKLGLLLTSRRYDPRSPTR